jgi:surface antigen
MVIKLFIFIIDLPFTILSLIWKVLKITVRFLRRYGWMVIWYGVYFLLQKPIRLLYALAVLMMLAMGGWFWWHTTRAPQGELPPIPSLGGEHEAGQPTQASLPANPLASAMSFQSVAQLPPMQGKIANANSVFAKPLMERMEPQDLRAYSSYFYYAMSSVKSGQPYRWLASNSLFGELIVEAAFQADSGVVCRRFTERLSYRGSHERFEGVACQRDARSWCKLRPKSALTCGIARPSSFTLWWKKIW